MDSRAPAATPESLERLLVATKDVVVATGILNLWFHTPEEVSQAHAALVASHGSRLLLGIGVSHQVLVDSQEPGRYQKPLSAMGSYLDALDAAHPPLDRDYRVLAALGPKMLDLAKARAAGCHPYNVTSEHTQLALLPGLRHSCCRSKQWRDHGR